MLGSFIPRFHSSMIRDEYGIRYVMPSLSIATQPDRDGFILSRCKSKSVLNVGCVGTKSITDSMHIKINEVSSSCIGIDINRIGLDYLTKFNPSLELFDSDISTEDFSNSSIGSRKFDLIIFGEVLEHMASPGTALVNAASLLNPNGSVLLTVPNAFCLTNVLANIIRGKELVRQDHVCYFSYSTIYRLLSMTGFSDIRIGYYLCKPQQFSFKSLVKAIFGKVIYRF